MLMCGSVVQNWWDEIKFRGILGGEDGGRQQESGRKTYQPTKLLIYSQKRIVIIKHLSPAVLWDVDIVRQISHNPGTPLPAESHESRLNCDACPVYYMFTCQTCSPWICGECRRRGTLPGRVPASSWPPSREEAGTGRLRWSWWRSPPRSPLPCSTSHVTRDTWHVTHLVTLRLVWRVWGASLNLNISMAPLVSVTSSSASQREATCSSVLSLVPQID